MASPKKKTGTKEWSDHSFNVGIGCHHACRYGWCKFLMERWHHVKKGEFGTERLKKEIPKVQKKEGWIMCPTTHDISPFYLPTLLPLIKKHLQIGNKLLLVTKPHKAVIETLCKELVLYPFENLMFRFTISTQDEELARFWEPGAPRIDERMGALMLAFYSDYQTSVSMEPMLAGKADAIENFHAVWPYVTDKVWIGKMNRIGNCVDQTEPAVRFACNRIRELQSDEEIMGLVTALKDEPKVEWKDSIKQVIERWEKKHKEQ